MIRATELSGRPVIDINAAEKVGSIEKLILDPDGKRVAGFVLTRGGMFATGKDHSIIPASAIHAIGPDAVTIKREAIAPEETTRLEALRKGSEVIGRKVLTEDGRYLGKVGDVLIETDGGRIFGYVLTDHQSQGKHPYLPADANLRAGKDLILASESAMRYEWKDAPAPTTAGRWTDPFHQDDPQPPA